MELSYYDIMEEVNKIIKALDDPEATKQNRIDAWEALEIYAKAGQKLEAETY